MSLAALPACRSLLDRVGGFFAEGGQQDAGGEVCAVVDPSTAAILVELPTADDADIDAVLAGAELSYRGHWSTLEPRDRADALRAFADALADAADELATVEALNTGKPLPRAKGEVRFAERTLRYFAATPSRPRGEVNPGGRHLLCYTDRVPVGVCAAITPSNYPLLLAVWKAAAALAHGNTVVVKPAEETPLSTLRLAEVARDAGLPTGAFSVVTGGPGVGSRLCAHPRVGAVSFTGSTEAGRCVGALCARHVKPVSLELGGKSPVIVFADADLDTAADAIVAGCMGNSGQLCVAASRVIVERAIHRELVERVRERVAALRVGPAWQPEADLGPLVSAAGRDRVLAFVRRACRDGVRAYTNGQQCPAEPGAERGFYASPTVFDHVDPASSLATQEIFGPVTCVLPPFETEAEALALAHATPYGLAASVWTSRLGRAHRLVRDLRAGAVWVNTYGDTEESVSVGGMGLSGYGRELGVHASGQYSLTRSVWIAHADGAAGR